MPLACPACKNIALNTVSDPHTGLEIDACPQCEGLWFDAQELSRFLQSPTLRQRFLWSDSAHPFKTAEQTVNISQRRCPHCLAAMNEKVYGGVTLDACPHCQGIWFDKGEVRTIVERYQTGTGGDHAIQAELSEGMQVQTVVNFVHAVDFLL